MHDSPLVHVAQLLLILSVIFVAAKIGGEIARRYLHIPPVLGELLAGILISPYAFGGVELFGVGPLIQTHNNLPVAEELFFFGQMAVVLLLFEIGLETNRKQFISNIKPATFVAAGGVLLPFIFGFGTTVLLGFASIESMEAMIPALFVGTIMTATSISITARVLSDLGRLNSREGVTILGGAVIDDVLGIIILAIVVGISQEGSITPMTVTMIVLKALGFWLGLTVIGSFISTKLSKLALWFKTPGSPLVITIVYGLIAAAIAEVYFGLAMIIGSYTMGLVLSDTDLRHKIEKSVITINKIFVPAFFVIVGMQLDLSSFTGTGDKSMFSLVLFAIVLTVLAIFSKMIGSGLPALLFGFKKKESLRIGLGMVPRGEVALIIGGIAITSGVIGSGIFGVSIVMVIVTTILAPILLNLTYKD